MDLSTFIVSVFCLIDDRLKKERRIRRCGPAPKLSDAEVLTIEVVGEFLGIETPTKASTATSADTTANGFLPSREFTAPPSAAKRPISGS
jgi:hypothetical protein